MNCPDVYLFVAASALAANTVVRSIAAAGFPVRGFTEHSSERALTFTPIAVRVSDV